jgi:flagellar basal body rod protein FlgG
MNYGLQLAASGALTGLHRMDVLSNNLANLSTTAFKPDIPGVRSRDAARIEEGLPRLPSNKMLEKLGGGVFAAPDHTSFEQGTLTRTGNPMDVAIEGPGFFVARDETDTVGDRLRLTRDGRFLRDAQGQLASATTGMPLLDVSNRPIVIASDAPITISPDGVIRQKGSVVAKLQVVEVSDNSRLTKVGRGSYLAPTDLMAGRHPASGSLQQETLEGSAVDPMGALMALTDASRAVDTAVNLMQGHDRLADRAINGLGRFS